MLKAINMERFDVEIEEKEKLTDAEIVNLLKHEHGDSFYIFDKEKLRKNFLRLKQAFKTRYSNFIIGYSYKTNYVPSLIIEMSKLGAYAEVVSRLEYDLALKIGEHPNRIIFNGPFKRYDDIKLALDGGSILNLDSFYEVEKIKKYLQHHPNKQVKIGLRVSFDLTIDGHNPLQSGFKLSRFGFCAENENFSKVITDLKLLPNVKIVGIHGHFSTNTRSLAVYEKITEKLCELAKKYLADTIEYIDVGGGFYGNIPSTMNIINAPTFDEYAETICRVINREKVHFQNDPLLIIEPGMAIAVDTFKFYSQVMDVKRNQDECFVLVKGSIHNIKPTMHSNNLPMKHIKSNDENYENGKFNVVGYTCMEKDYLAIDYKGEVPKVGDFLVFSNVGAYTIVFDPPFIKERPPIISMEDSGFNVVRKRETIQEFINENVYVF